MGDSFMTFQDVFEKFKDEMKDKDISKIDGHLAFQFNITGEGEGKFYAEVNDGVLHIEPYEYYDRDAIFICSAKTLFGIISGKTDPIMAFTIGKLKVEGSIEKALKIKDII